MTITVNLPDGTVVNFPDGTSQEVMKSALAKRFPPKAASTGAVGGGGVSASAGGNMDASGPLPVDQMSLPAGADPATDFRVGVSETGSPVYQMPAWKGGAQYTIEAAAPTRPKGGYIRAVAGALARDPLGAIGSTLGAVGHGLYDTAAIPGNAASGQMPTTGDILGLASMVPMGAGGSAIKGATKAATPNPLLLQDLSKSIGVIAERPGFVRGPTSPIGMGGPVAPVGGGVGGATATMTMTPTMPAVRPANSLMVVPQSAGALPEVGMADQVKTLAQMVEAAKKPGGMKAKALAGGFAVDQKLVDTAAKLGIDMPADVFATNPMIRSVAGLTRGLKGSDTEAKWLTSIANAANTAESAMRKIADTDMSAVSQTVFNTLDDAQRHVAKEAGKLYDEVAKVVPPATQIASPRAVTILERRAADLGGIEKLAPDERALLKSLSEGPTYEWVKTKKGSLGNTAFGAVDPYPNFGTALKRKLTVAMGEDMVDSVAEIGGEAAGQAVRLANRLWEKNKGIQERIIAGFGKDKEGSIAIKLSTAVKNAANRGDTTVLNKMLKIIPDDMSREAVWTAITDATRAKGGSVAGSFGFSEFAKLHRGLKQNSAAYKQITGVLGEEATQLIDDLANVSTAIAAARAEVPMTGKANQVLAMLPEGLATKVKASPTARRAAKGAGAAVGAVVGGPVGAAVGAEIMDTAVSAMKSADSSAFAAISNLLHDPQFMALAVKEAKGLDVASDIAKLKARPSYQAFLRATTGALQSAPMRAAVGQAVTSQPSYMRHGGQ